MRSKGHPFAALVAATRDNTAGLLYHASTGCRNFDALLAWEGPFFVDYHNITDPAFFERWSPGASDNMRLARRQLAQLATRCDVAIAHSHFSAEELAAGKGIVHTALDLKPVPGKTPASWAPHVPLRDEHRVARRDDLVQRLLE